MLLSESHQFIFVHIPKVAGVSIETNFKEFAVNNKGSNGEKLIRHSIARQIRDTLPGDIFRNYFKFAFVRNPWDRWVSLYFFILQKTTHEEHERVKSFRNFDKFVVESINQKRAQQINAITDENGKFLVDFVGRYETLVEDIHTVCRILNISKKTAFPYLNQSRHRDYRAYYSEETKRMVEEYFKDDIRLFGYTFEGLKEDARRFVKNGALVSSEK